ncbi:antitoxin Xre-like helix-turn-helix domain-containing protein [Pseudomonas sp. TMW22090]|uniref:antitoxin Xre-like helix-turn-helix domain-containing protein n=1 Tax=Pseudomonas sp. TMW22090 TaxID=2506434 RepID=UPI003211D957
MVNLSAPSRGTTLNDLLRRGLPYEYFNRIARTFQVEPKVISQAIGAPPASQARRATTGGFSTVESDRLVPLIAVFEQALFLLEDDVTAATEWMSAPPRWLGSHRPLEMLSTRVLDLPLPNRTPIPR